jgi:Flp pilus assembly protein TadG
MLSRPPLSGRLGQLIAAFRDARRGATAVEFAMLALPFFSLTCGIIEIGLIFIVSTTLENATSDTARMIRTGQLQTVGGATASTFATQICTELSWLGSCASNLNVDVRTFSQFSAITAPQPIKNNAFDPTAMTFQMGGPGDIVVVHAYYQWSLFTPLMNQGLQNLSGGKMLITSAATFRNEPYAPTS